MTSGPGHYREAERLLAEAAEFPDLMVHVDRPVSQEDAELIRQHFIGRFGKRDPIVTAQPVTVDMSATLAAAQVHATLALAAATAYQAEKDYLGDEADSRSWVQVTA